MDALLIVPAAVVSFGGAYYLGRACLTVFIGSLEQSRKSRLTAPKSAEVPARALRSADTLVG
jgi:hypothetical protein